MSFSQSPKIIEIKVRPMTKTKFYNLFTNKKRNKPIVTALEIKKNETPRHFHRREKIHEIRARVRANYLAGLALILLGFDELALRATDVVARLSHAVLDPVHHVALGYVARSCFRRRADSRVVTCRRGIDSGERSGSVCLCVFYVDGKGKYTSEIPEVGVVG